MACGIERESNLPVFWVSDEDFGCGSHPLYLILFTIEIRSVGMSRPSIRCFQPLAAFRLIIVLFLPPVILGAFLLWFLLWFDLAPLRGLFTTLCSVIFVGMSLLDSLRCDAFSVYVSEIQFTCTVRLYSQG